MGGKARRGSCRPVTPGVSVPRPPLAVGPRQAPAEEPFRQTPDLGTAGIGERVAVGVGVGDGDGELVWIQLHTDPGDSSRRAATLADPEDAGESAPCPRSPGPRVSRPLARPTARWRRGSRVPRRHRCAHRARRRAWPCWGAIPTRVSELKRAEYGRGNRALFVCQTHSYVDARIDSRRLDERKDARPGTRRRVRQATHAGARGASERFDGAPGVPCA